MDTILQILQWAIPGGGIGAAIAWLVHRSAANAKDAKTVHDTYKEMYHDLGVELEKLQMKVNKLSDVNGELSDRIKKLTDENDELRKAINRLRATLLEIKRCPHYADCPVRSELRDSEGTAVHGGNQRQRKGRDSADGKGDNGAGGGGHGVSDGDAGDDGLAAGERGVHGGEGRGAGEPEKDAGGRDGEREEPESREGDGGSCPDGGGPRRGDGEDQAPRRGGWDTFKRRSNGD